MSEAPRFSVVTANGTLYNPAWMAAADVRRAAAKVALEENIEASAMQEHPSGEWITLDTFRP